MKIISFPITSLKKDSFVEFLHTFIELCRKCPALMLYLSRFLAPLLTQFAEVERIYKITIKSPLTALMQNIDSQRDGVVTGLKALVRSYQRSENFSECAAADKLMFGLDAISYDRNCNIFQQTGQIDNLLSFLDDNAEQVETLGLASVVEQLRRVNDRMHELILGRSEEYIDKELEAFANARKEAEEAYRKFVDAVNSLVYIDTDKLNDDEVELGQFTLGQFITTANGYIEYVLRKVLKLQASVADKDEEEAEGEEGEGEGPAEAPQRQVTITFRNQKGDVVTRKGFPGRKYRVPVLVDGFIWVASTGQTGLATGEYPDEDMEFFEMPTTLPKVTYHFINGAHETFTGEPEAAYIIPTPTIGYQWTPEPTGRFPERDQQHFETLIPEQGGGEEGGGNNTNPNEPTDPEGGDNQEGEQTPDLTPGMLWPADRPAPPEWCIVTFRPAHGEPITKLYRQGATIVSQGFLPENEEGYIWSGIYSKLNSSSHTVEEVEE